MASNPQVSIIVVLRNTAEELEEHLRSLLHFDSVPAEFIIIDDASTDGTPEIVNSIIENESSDHIYYYPFEEFHGRANALNFAIGQINAPYVWVVDQLSGVNRGLPDTLLSELRNREAAASYAGSTSLPDDLHRLIHNCDTLLNSVEDRQFLWNWSKVPAEHRYFNPHWSTCHSLDLAMRVQQHSEIVQSEGVQNASGQPVTAQMRRNYYQSLLNHPDLTTALREEIFRLIRAQDEVVLDQKRNNWIDEQYHRALHQIDEGSPRAALDTLNAILEIDPENRNAEDLKFKVLNRMNRYVEAAEIKHRKSRSDQQETRDTGASQDQEHEASAPTLFDEPHPPESQDEPGDQPTDTQPEAEQHNEPPEAVLTIVIPTAGSGLPLLERCLNSIHEHCDSATTRVIIIDNASLDETHDYLDQLREKNFFQCNVITNSWNKGFGASVNQGLEQVETPYVCVMHNDIQLEDDIPGLLVDLIEQTGYSVIGPTTAQTMIEEQYPQENPPGEVIETDYLDSFLFVFRKDAGVMFDEMFGPAFFDNLDFCREIRQQGGKCGVAANIQIYHEGEATLSAFGLISNSKEYWKNEAYFKRKWDLEPQISDDLSEEEPITQLALIGEVINVFYPEKHLLGYVSELITSEVRTELMQEKFTEEALEALIRLMIALNERELLRRFEDQLTEFPINEELYFILVQFYFDQNIYSRCLKYLDALQDDEPFHFAYYRLRIAVAERNLNQAVPLLKQLLEEQPDHPGLIKLAGDIQAQNSNQQEAEKFYDLAAQIDPFRFPNKQVTGS